MKIPYVKGIDKETGQEITGFYVEYPETTYCFNTDYKSESVPIVKAIVFHSMTDWGLPNTLRICNSIDESTIELIGYVETSNTFYNPDNWIQKDN